MKDLIPKFTHSFGKNAEVIALAERLEQHYTPRDAVRVYNFLCEQFGLIRTLLEIENDQQRGYITNVYRSHVREHTPTAFDENLRNRTVSIIQSRLNAEDLAYTTIV